MYIYTREQCTNATLWPLAPFWHCCYRGPARPNQAQRPAACASESARHGPFACPGVYNLQPRLILAKITRKTPRDQARPLAHWQSWPQASDLAIANAGPPRHVRCNSCTSPEEDFTSKYLRPSITLLEIITVYYKLLQALNFSLVQVISDSITGMVDQLLQE